MSQAHRFRALSLPPREDWEEESMLTSLSVSL